jgi:hypothetical protein
MRIRGRRVQFSGSGELWRSKPREHTMSTGETRTEEVLPDEPNVERSSLADVQVPPMIQKALERHRRDLPELMKSTR